jgi:D-3-phosphoglycerate dehydrogenase
MTTPNILITDGLDEKGQSILRASATVDDRNDISAADLLNGIAGYDGLIVRGRTKVTASVIEAATRLKVIGRAGVGVDNIDLEAASKRGIVVVNAPGSTTVAVAELAFGLMLSLARDIPRADSGMKQGTWLKKELEGIELNGKTLGIIGMGRIGTQVGKYAATFGMSVIAHNPQITDEQIRERGAKPVSLADLYTWSDYITLHLPYTEQTRGMLGESAFAQMKDGVRIVSTARGGIIDEAALLAALKNGKVAGVALDVFAQEPHGLTELISHPRVIGTPHVGAQTAEAQARASVDIAEEVLSALLGKPLRWKVN